MKKIFSNDYLRLFIRRESKVVVGNRMVNLWILAVMLLLTFLAIAFSNASLSYLQQKMDDPFTNWVNIPVADANKLKQLHFDLGDTTSVLREKYGIVNFSVDHSSYYTFYGKTENIKPYLGCLYFQSFNVNNPLLNAILDPSNVVNECAVDTLFDQLLGVIITKEKMESLGYNDTTSYPAFVSLRQYTDSSASTKYGITLYGDSVKFAAIPLPVLAVVRKLPMNMDIVASSYLFRQQQSGVFNLNDSVPNKKLTYAVADQEVADKMVELLDENAPWGAAVGIGRVYMPYNLSYQDLHICSVTTGLLDSLPYADLIELDKQVQSIFPSHVYRRVYDYNLKGGDSKVAGNTFVSVQFNSDGLKNIRTFSNYLNEEYNVDIEMAQIQSKENFSAVSVTATILTWTIIFFALVSVILFIVNLLRTYFQRVKRNMGTFKAFGMSNRELIGIYILILIAIVSGAVIISLIAVVIIQLLLAICHLTYQGGSPYLLLGNINTLFAILVILASSVLTVYWVMKNQLSATPGDLIYDR